MISKFLIQVEHTAKTRWITEPQTFMLKVLVQVQGVASGATEGEIPECSIMMAEQAADIRVLAALDIGPDGFASAITRWENKPV